MFVSRTGGQLVETSGVGDVAVVGVEIVVCWVCQLLIRLVWQVSVAVGALYVLACRVGLVARWCRLVRCLVVGRPLWLGERPS